MKRFIIFAVFVVTLLTPAKSFRKEVEQLFNGTNTNLTDELKRNLEAVKNTNAPQGIRDIYDKKGEEFKKLEEVFTKKCHEEYKRKLKKKDDTLKAQIEGQMSKVREVFHQNFDRFRDIAVAEHYREVKPFYDFVCAFRLVDDTLENVWRKAEYGGVSRARNLMTEMNKKDETKTIEDKKSPSHLEFANYIVPGEKRHEVDIVYDKWRLYLSYELNELATKIRNELELIRGERRIEDLVTEFCFATAKLAPFAKFVHRDVIPRVRGLAEDSYRRQITMAPFLDELPKLMPQNKWYFPEQYSTYFNVLRRALGRRDLETREYRRGNAKTIIPESDECAQGADYQGIYKYVNMYFSTTPKLSINAG